MAKATENGTTEDTFQPPRLEDSQLQLIADRVLHTLPLAAEKAVAHLSAPGDYPMPSAGESEEQVFLRRLRARPADRQQAERLAARTSVAGSTRRTYRA